MKGKVAPTKSTTKAYVSFCFSFSADSAIVSPALYRFLYRQWNKQNYSTPFPKCFYFFSEKNSFSKTFLVECVLSRSGATSCNKRREFWRETHTPLWLQVLIGRIIFFTCENHRSLLWLARTNLRTKIYDITFWWVFLSMSIIKINIHFSGAKLWNAIKEQLKSASRFRFKKLLKEQSVISKYWLVYYIQLIVCTAPVLTCFLLLRLFVCAFVDLLQLKIFSLWVFVCIFLFITTLMVEPLSAISFCYFWVAVLSFFHNYFLFMTLHFCIKSTIKIVFVCCLLD